MISKIQQLSQGQLFESETPNLDASKDCRYDKNLFFLWFRNRRIEYQFLGALYGEKLWWFLRLPLANSLCFIVILQFGFTAEVIGNTYFWVLLICSGGYFLAAFFGVFVYFIKGKLPFSIILYESLCFIVFTVGLAIIIMRDVVYEGINGIFMLQFAFAIVLRLRFYFMFIALLISWVVHLAYRVLYRVGLRKFGSGSVELTVERYPFYVVIYTAACAMCLILLYVLENDERKTFVKTKTLKNQSVKMKQERKVMEILLFNVVPFEYVEHLKNKRNEQVQKDDKSVISTITVKENVAAMRLFLIDEKKNAIAIISDLVNFTSWCASKTPHEVIGVLNSHYKLFDMFSQYLGIQKVKTVGDSFMGYIHENDEEVSQLSVESAILFSVAAILCVKKIMGKTQDCENEMKLRIGIASGDLICSFHKGNFVTFDIFGPCYREACLLESKAIPNHVFVTENLYHMLKKHVNFSQNNENMVCCDAPGAIFKQEYMEQSLNQLLRDDFEKIFSHRVKTMRKRIGKKEVEIQEAIESPDVGDVGPNLSSSLPSPSSPSSPSGIFSSQTRYMKTRKFSSLSKQSQSGVTSIVRNIEGTFRAANILQKIFVNREGLIFPLFCFDRIENEKKYLRQDFENSSFTQVMSILLMLVFSIIGVFYFPSFGVAEELYKSFHCYALYFAIVLQVFLLVIIVLNVKFAKSMWVELCCSVLSFASMLPYSIFFNSIVRNVYMRSTFHVENISFVAISSLVCFSFSNCVHTFLKLFIVVVFDVIYALILASKYEMDFGYDKVYNNLIDIAAVTMSMFLYQGWRDLIHRRSFAMEIRIKKRTRFLREEKDLNMSLVLSVLPEFVMKRMKKEEFVCEKLPFSFVCYLSLGNVLSSEEMISRSTIQFIVNTFDAFDEILSQTECLRIKQINENYLFLRDAKNQGQDSYRVKSSEELNKLEDEHPNQRESQLAFNEVITTVWKCIQSIEREKRNSSHSHCCLKVGLVYGAVSAGILGYGKLLWDIVGDVVNKSARLTCLSDSPAEVHVLKENLSEFLEESTLPLIVRDNDREINVKGIGGCETQYLSFPDSDKPVVSEDRFFSEPEDGK